MKKILLLAVLALALGFTQRTEAQVRINVQIGAPVVQQTWYDYDDDYYYMPDQGVYYNVRRQVYVYPYGGSWVYAPSLPPSYGGCSFNSVRYYRIHARAPFQRHSYYRSQYPVGYGGGGYYRDNGYRHDNGRHNGWRNNDRGRGWDNDRRGDRGDNWNRDRRDGNWNDDRRGDNRGNNNWNGGPGRPDRR